MEDFSMLFLLALVTAYNPGMCRLCFSDNQRNNVMRSAGFSIL